MHFLTLRIVLFSSTLDVPSDSWIIYSIVLYGVMCLFILRSAWTEMAVLTAQVKDLSPGMAVVATGEHVCVYVCVCVSVM